jgi:hypothetical protein
MECDQDCLGVLELDAFSGSRYFMSMRGLMKLKRLYISACLVCLLFCGVASRRPN